MKKRWRYGKKESMYLDNVCYVMYNTVTKELRHSFCSGAFKETHDGQGHNQKRDISSIYWVRGHFSSEVVF